MRNRRILSIWFPRLAAERHIRRDPNLGEVPFVVVKDVGQAQVVASLSEAAEAIGLYEGQPLRDAHAMSADLLTRLSNPHAEAAFLNALHRWAGKFSPWVAQEKPDALVLDLTGCAHLFDGEEALARQVDEDCRALGLTVRLGIADTLGCAWALARFAGAQGAHHRNGDAIDQEARATRSRAGKRRHWERGGAAPAVRVPAGQADMRIAAPGETYRALADLPLAALRLEAHSMAQLSRLGLRRVRDLVEQPRAGLVRRFGRGLVARMDQALGSVPEPVSAAPPPDRFAVRLSLPDPIGLEDDVMAAIDRMLPRLCAALRNKGKGARTLRLEVYRCDDTMQWMSVTLAKPSDDPEQIRPLLRLRIEDLDAGYGIDMMRLEAAVHEPIHLRTYAGHMEATEDGRARMAGTKGKSLDRLIGRLGTRLGTDAITRLHPADSHIPEKTSLTVTAAWSEPAKVWPARHLPRPLIMWPPEMVIAPDVPRLPGHFRWRGRDHEIHSLRGPERIAPEWWLDDPAWRSGPRDYWDVITRDGHRLWLFYAHGGTLSSGWFCQGAFA
ncbi:DNA polymerase Y family protein [Marivita sp. GX14005]|uniref:Y-family DNA polymerase n=1 Tax=Marivita sp. GX14005 TaxID=2942276 RepID=UPI00201955DD|nr:DNA polymerase Y family protein [Marivita sp. GX14005]MCL3881343.1 DNA polymerase Y family protein [Marivita sp. GX14005]